MSLSSNILDIAKKVSNLEAQNAKLIETINLIFKEDEIKKCPSYDLFKLTYSPDNIDAKTVKKSGETVNTKSVPSIYDYRGGKKKSTKLNLTNSTKLNTSKISSSSKTSISKKTTDNLIRNAQVIMIMFDGDSNKYYIDINTSKIYDPNGKYYGNINKEGITIRNGKNTKKIPLQKKVFKTYSDRDFMVSSSDKEPLAYHKLGNTCYYNIGEIHDGELHEFSND